MRCWQAPRPRPCCRDRLDRRRGVRAADRQRRTLRRLLEPPFRPGVDQLAVDASLAARMSLLGEAEAILWNEMPTIPLFDQPRTIAHSKGMHAVVPNPTRSGSGWNMDR
ncbi:hypothetical protein GS934_07030 [Rhodococcus hoagii]|nr:hypothetical protein [Prescottella equi]NKZ87382.1 hypothetical protein [Prescottella equi]